MNTMRIGIMNRQDFRRYTIDIAKGKMKPALDAPKVWFDSVESMAQVGTKIVEPRAIEPNPNTSSSISD